MCCLCRYCPASLSRLVIAQRKCCPRQKAKCSSRLHRASKQEHLPPRQQQQAQAPNRTHGCWVAMRRGFHSCVVLHAAPFTWAQGSASSAMPASIITPAMPCTLNVSLLVSGRPAVHTAATSNDSCGQPSSLPWFVAEKHTTRAALLQPNL